MAKENLDPKTVSGWEKLSYEEQVMYLKGLGKLVLLRVVLETVGHFLGLAIGTLLFIWLYSSMNPPKECSRPSVTETIQLEEETNAWQEEDQVY